MTELFMNIKTSIVYASVFISSYSMAAPHDLFLTAQSLKTSDKNFELTLAFDAVNDNIDIFNFREKEGIKDSSAGDYQGFHITGKYDISPQWQLEGSFWQREIDYSQDTNELQSYLMALRYTPDFNLDKRDALSFRASVWGNQSDELSKTTPTQVKQYTFEKVNVQNPEDLQLQLDAIFSRKLDPMNQLNVYANVGYSKVKISQLDIQAMYDNCLMNISVDSNNQYHGNLANSCKYGKFELIDLEVGGFANEFGLDIQKDLNYDSYYASLGGSWNWRYKNFESQLAYQYQHIWRNDIDDRVSQLGNSPIKDNHSLGAKFSYDFSPQVTAFLQAELYKHNMIGQIPLLYNGVTASRLDKKYGLGTLGVTLRF